MLDLYSGGLDTADVLDLEVDRTYVSVLQTRFSEQLIM